MHKKSAFILLFSVAVLISIGIVMLFSAGAFASDGHGDQFSFLRKQGFWLGFGFVVAVACATIDYRWWQRGWIVLIAASYLLLALCFIRPFGLYINHSYRWVRLGSVTVQPSELAKFAVVVFVAWWFAKFESERNRIVKGLLIPFAVVGGILALIVKETDLGTTAMIGGTALLDYVCCRGKPAFPDTHHSCRFDRTSSLCLDVSRKAESIARLRSSRAISE